MDSITSTTASPPITISAVTLDDATSVASNQVAAFWTDPSWVLIWPGKTCEYVTSQQARRMPATLLDQPEVRRHEKAVEAATGELVGYARWTLPSGGENQKAPGPVAEGDGRDSGGEKGDIPVEVAMGDEIGDVDDAGASGRIESRGGAVDGGQQKLERQLLRPGQMWPSARVPGVSDEKRQQLNKERETADWDYDRSMDEIEGPMMEMKERLLKDKNYMVLEVLAVAPPRRNKGIATALVRSGLQQADALGLDVFIHAMKAALGVYKRTGFELVDSIVLDDSSYGGLGEYGHYFLVRKATKRSKELRDA